MNEKLMKKEESFCRYYALLGSGREAAQKAGFTVMPEYRALCLLSKKSIAERIKALKDENEPDEKLAAAGIRRLAFGSPSDAVKLMLACAEGKVPDIDALDLFAVSEIKYTQGKGMEIKFSDRLKALEKLAEVSAAGSASNAASFYEALERSAAGCAGAGING